MHELQKRYAVEDSFFHRYFIRNAENRFVNNLKRFMLWREGRFHDPKDKLGYVRSFLAEELENFYEKGHFILPQIGFSLTTRCTLRCRDCIALSPLFDEARPGFTHIDQTAEAFKRELALIADSVDGIKRLFLHGGEPLLNKDLPEIVQASVECEKIELVELITNGTVVPSEALLDVAERYKHKIYFAINDYSKNPALAGCGRLHRDEIVSLLDARGIKHPLFSDLHWYRQKPLEDQNYTPEQTRRLFNACWCKHSLQILDGILAICPRASLGHLLGLVKTPPQDIIDLRANGEGDLRRELIRFYQKDSFFACAYCAPQKEVIEPAIQVEH